MIATRNEYCPQNHACPVIKTCPFDAIEQKDAYSAPTIIKEKCKDCGICTKYCRVFVQN